MLLFTLGDCQLIGKRWKSHWNVQRPQEDHRRKRKKYSCDCFNWLRFNVILRKKKKIIRELVQKLWHLECSCCDLLCIGQESHVLYSQTVWKLSEHQSFVWSCNSPVSLLRATKSKFITSSVLISFKQKMSLLFKTIYE